MNFIFSSILVLLFLYTAPSDYCSVNRVLEDSVMQGPQIAFDSAEINLGELPRGQFATHTYKVSNPGDRPLRIRSIRTSCGCTAAILGDSLIFPGRSTQLDVKFDSRGKALGLITKSVLIYSNAIKDSFSHVSFHVTIVSDTIREHRQAMGGSQATMHLDGIFSGDCAACHVDKGKGLLGMALYKADCAVCHGGEEGKPGPDLTTDRMLNHTTEEWKKVISSGIPSSNMPAFGRERQGPLNETEIASIVEFLNAVRTERNGKIPSDQTKK